MSLLEVVLRHYRADFVLVSVGCDFMFCCISCMGCAAAAYLWSPFTMHVYLFKDVRAILLVDSKCGRLSVVGISSRTE